MSRCRKFFKLSKLSVMTAKKESNNNVTLNFVNCTPHPIKLNDGRIFEPSGTIARVSQSISEFDENSIAVQSFGEVTNLPEPKAGTVYIVSAMVLGRAQIAGRTDVVAPATGHKNCVRDDKGYIISVPGFIR